MKRVEQKDFVNYTIIGSGWSVTISNFIKALEMYKVLSGAATFRGNKHDGSFAILDTKD